LTSSPGPGPSPTHPVFALLVAKLPPFGVCCPACFFSELALQLLIFLVLFRSGPRDSFFLPHSRFSFCAAPFLARSAQFSFVTSFFCLVFFRPPGETPTSPSQNQLECLGALLVNALSSPSQTTCSPFVCLVASPFGRWWWQVQHPHPVTIYYSRSLCFCVPPPLPPHPHPMRS